jgi:hypothetical protein
MKNRLHVEAEARAQALPEAVWRLVADADTYCRWGIWSESSWVGLGAASPGRPGSLRQMRYRRTRIVEQVLEVDEGTRLAYTVVRGIPVRNYRAEVTLTPERGATHVRWVADWDNTFLGRIVQRKLSVLYPEIMTRLVQAAEQIAPRDRHSKVGLDRTGVDNAEARHMPDFAGVYTSDLDQPGA